jgi:hypothetical protein
MQSCSDLMHLQAQCRALGKIHSLHATLGHLFKRGWAVHGMVAAVLYHRVDLPVITQQVPPKIDNRVPASTIVLLNTVRKPGWWGVRGGWVGGGCWHPCINR